MHTVTAIHMTDFANIYAQGLSDEVLLLDVRTAAEFHEEHLDGAVNVPLSELDTSLEQLRGYNLIYIYCRTGRRSHSAGELLQAAGLAGVINLDGGIVAWKEQHHAIHQNSNIGLSIDRQFKLIAGIGVITGVLLSQWVHIGWLGVPLFIGSGLTFAGVSGICLLAILLAKMPWNRREAQSASHQLQASGRSL